MHASRDSVFRILRAASLFEIKQRKLRQRTENIQQTERLFLLLTAFPFALSIAQAGLMYFFDFQWLRTSGLVMLLLAYLGFLISPFLAAVIHRKALHSFLQHPFNVLLDNAAGNAAVDSRYLPNLERKPTHLLELISLEMKEEQKFFERRIMLIVGAIEKLGLFPGLLAAFLAITKIPRDLSQWVLALAYATPLLYLFGVFGHFLAMRMSRLNSLLDLAIAHKKNALTKPSTGRQNALRFGAGYGKRWASVVSQRRNDGA